MDKINTNERVEIDAGKEVSLVDTFKYCIKHLKRNEIEKFKFIGYTIKPNYKDLKVDIWVTDEDVIENYVGESVPETKSVRTINADDIKNLPKKIGTREYTSKELFNAGIDLHSVEILRALYDFIRILNNDNEETNVWRTVVVDRENNVVSMFWDNSEHSKIDEYIRLADKYEPLNLREHYYRPSKDDRRILGVINSRAVWFIYDGAADTDDFKRDFARELKSEINRYRRIEEEHRNGTRLNTKSQITDLFDVWEADKGLLWGI